MKKYSYLINIFLITLVILAGVKVVSAQPVAPDVNTINFFPTRFTSVEGVVQGVLTWLIGIAGGLGTLAVAYSGVMYLTAGGDPEKATKARKNLVWAITGVILAITALIIVQLVNNMINNRASKAAGELNRNSTTPGQMNKIEVEQGNMNEVIPAPVELKPQVDTDKPNELTLTWTPVKPKYSTVSGYKIYRDGTLVSDAKEPVYKDTTIMGGKTYEYSVEAYDDYGNISPKVTIKPSFNDFGQIIIKDF